MSSCASKWTCLRINPLQPSGKLCKKNNHFLPIIPLNVIVGSGVCMKLITSGEYLIFSEIPLKVTVWPAKWKYFNSNTIKANTYLFLRTIFNWIGIKLFISPLVYQMHALFSGSLSFEAMLHTPQIPELLLNFTPDNICNDPSIHFCKNKLTRYNT